jgi:integrase
LKSVDTRPDFSYALPTMPKLWKRPSNGTFYVTWQEAGKQRKRSLKTKEQRIAVRLFNAFKRDLVLKKVAPIGGKLTVMLSDFKDEFLDHIHATLAISTYECYETALKKAVSCWGDIPVGHITKRRIDKLIKEMSKSGLKVPTINKNRRHLKAALNKAHEWDYLKAPIKFPPGPKEEETVRYLTKKELSKVLARIDDNEFADVVLLAAYTGLRSSEILRLKPDDVDNPEGFLRISSKQKNKKASWIPINDAAREILNRCVSRGMDKVVRFKTRQTLSKKFKKAVRAAGLEPPRFHDLRHTFGSHLAMMDVGEKSIQELMRHKSMASTLVYTHVSPKHLSEASNKINYGPMPIRMQKTGQNQDSDS